MQSPLAGICVLFDLDGTLVDTAADLGAAMNHALGKAGLPGAPLHHVRSLVGHGARAMLLRALGGNETAPDPALIDRLLADFIDHYRDNIAVHSRPFAGILDALDTIAADGAAIAICTNKREALARQLIAELGLDERFACIIGGDTTGAAKPDAKPVLACLAATAAQTGVFIGDSDTDILAAKAAGMPALIADYGYGPLELIREAAGKFSAAAELPALVRQTAAKFTV